MSRIYFLNPPTLFEIDRLSDVVYIDAFTRESIEADLKSFAAAKRVGYSAQDSLRWLESHRERWLVIFDNADDPAVDLRAFFPKCPHGKILITTRNRDMAGLGGGSGSDYQVSGMSPADSLELLLKAADMHEQDLSEAELAVAKTLIKVNPDFVTH